MYTLLMTSDQDTRDAHTTPKARMHNIRVSSILHPVTSHPTTRYILRASTHIGKCTPPALHVAMSDAYRMICRFSSPQPKYWRGSQPRIILGSDGHSLKDPSATNIRHATGSLSENQTKTSNGLRCVTRERASTPWLPSPGIYGNMKTCQIGKFKISATDGANSCMGAHVYATAVVLI